MAGRGTDIMLGGNAEYLAKSALRHDGLSEELIIEATGFAETEDTEILEARAKYSEYYASKGYVCFRADYRVTKVNGSTPFQSLEDAKSAIRFIRKSAKEFRIDANKLVASGGSAGGHLAAACAFIDGYNCQEDDLSISAAPNALMLFNPVIDNGPDGYGYDRVGDKYPDFSPMHNVRTPVPPTIFQVGDKDKLVSVSTAEKYKQACENAGGRCDLVIYEGAQHGFFNKEEYFLQTLEHCDAFLESLNLE
jgi:acetyl esterase/lipase